MHRLLLLVVALLASACASTPITFGGTFTTEGVAFDVEGVLRVRGQVVAVEGAARNDGEVDFDRVAVVFELLDAAGVKVGDAGAEALGLRPGQTWRFDAPAKVKYRAKVRRVRIGRVELDPRAGD